MFLFASASAARTTKKPRLRNRKLWRRRQSIGCRNRLGAQPASLCAAGSLPGYQISRCPYKNVHAELPQMQARCTRRNDGLNTTKLRLPVDLNSMSSNTLDYKNVIFFCSHLTLTKLSSISTGKVT